MWFHRNPPHLHYRYIAQSGVYKHRYAVRTGCPKMGPSAVSVLQYRNGDMKRMLDREHMHYTYALGADSHNWVGKMLRDRIKDVKWFKVEDYYPVLFSQ